jgi:hypothetical protein
LLHWHNYYRAVKQNTQMNRFFRTLIAGYGAKKLGGGCFSTIIIFVIIYYLLGQCNRTPRQRNSFIEKPARATSFEYKSKLKSTTVVWLRNDGKRLVATN